MHHSDGHAPGSTQSGIASKTRCDAQSRPLIAQLSIESPFCAGTVFGFSLDTHGFLIRDLLNLALARHK